jgi:hypothetical protein
LELILILLLLLRETILLEIIQGLLRCRHLCPAFGNTFAYSKLEAAYCGEDVLTGFCFF